LAHPAGAQWETPRTLPTAGRKLYPQPCENDVPKGRTTRAGWRQGLGSPPAIRCWVASPAGSRRGRATRAITDPDCRVHCRRQRSRPRGGQHRRRAFPQAGGRLARPHPTPGRSTAPDSASRAPRPGSNPTPRLSHTRAAGFDLPDDMPRVLAGPSRHLITHHASPRSGVTRSIDPSKPITPHPTSRAGVTGPSSPSKPSSSDLDLAPRHGAECAFVGARAVSRATSLSSRLRGSQRVSTKVDPDRERAFIGHRHCGSRKPTIVRLPSSPACQRSACRCRPPRRSLISAVQPSLHAAASDLGPFTTTSMIRTP